MGYHLICRSHRFRNGLIALGLSSEAMPINDRVCFGEIMGHIWLSYDRNNHMTAAVTKGLKMLMAG